MPLYWKQEKFTSCKTLVVYKNKPLMNIIVSSMTKYDCQEYLSPLVSFSRFHTDSLILELFNLCMKNCIAVLEVHVYVCLYETFFRFLLNECYRQEVLQYI